MGALYVQGAINEVNTWVACVLLCLEDYDEGYGSSESEGSENSKVKPISNNESFVATHETTAMHVLAPTNDSFLVATSTIAGHVSAPIVSQFSLIGFHEYTQCCHTMEWFPSNEHRLLLNIAS
jgi:hypothetical protein